VGREGLDLESDEALLRRVAGGDPRALRVLYQRHAPWLMVRLERRCSDRGVVEDVVQDIFVAVWRRPTAYEGRGDVRAWMWGIGIRRLVDRLRRSRVPTRSMADLGGPWPSAEQEVLAGVEYGDLAGALNRLSPELRAVIQATVLDGLTTREAGRLLGIPSGTVKTRLMRARARLREELA
jgi:RNA polymerase sigma-70 factor (ECF subfamily)